jgi:hypothetical protein
MVFNILKMIIIFRLKKSFIENWIFYGRNSDIFGEFLFDTNVQSLYRRGIDH